MDVRELFTKDRILFVLIFSILAVIAYNFNFSPMLGTENQSFTLFQFFGPIAGAFLGPFFGSLTVLLAEGMNVFVIGKEINLINLIRLTPMMFAAFYFGSKGTKNIVAAVPIVCMALFMLHPIGSQVWYYSLYWLIPLIVKVLGVIPLIGQRLKDNLLFRSLGATFTAHAVGSVIFLYTFSTTVSLWQTLIPIVLFERAMFAMGISVSYLVANNLLIMVRNKVPEKVVELSEKYNFTRGVFTSRN
ncbi:MAG: hypothetical protein V1672_05170 [Candidatus Diapherotrites archaeon]